MVGKNWKKILAVGICGLMAAGVIAGCGNNSGSSGNSGKMKVGVVQIVQHPALDESNKGFVDALNESGQGQNRNRPAECAGRSVEPQIYC